MLDRRATTRAAAFLCALPSAVRRVGRLVLVTGKYKRPVARGHRQIVPRQYAMVVKGEVGAVTRTVAASP